MTNQTIPPCPVCGVVPMLDTNNGFVYVHMCKGTRISVYHHHWVRHCRNIIGRAAVEVYGIHTLAELAARLAPDPRVAVLEAAIIEHESETKGRVHPLGQYAINRKLWAVIAAQRGEVEK